MNNELMKRYIYAVTCHLPTKAQPEVEKELENMIAELLDARCGEREPTDADVRAVLTELGPPEELAVKYSGDENKALISGIYLLWFKKVLKIVLPIAAVGVAFATLISGIVKLQPPQNLGAFVPPMIEFIPELIAEAIAGAFSAAVQSILWVGLIFAILERKKVKFSGDEFLSKLRPVPDKRAQIQLHDPIMNILWCVAAAVLFLGFPYLIGGYSESIGWIPAFDESYIREFWYLVVLWTGFNIVHEIVKLIERRYSRRLVLVTRITHLFSGVSIAVLLGNNRMMNPAFTENIGTIVKGVGAEKIGMVAGHLNLLLLAVILFALLLEIGVTTYRAFRYDR